MFIIFMNLSKSAKAKENKKKGNTTPRGTNISKRKLAKFNQECYKYFQTHDQINFSETITLRPSSVVKGKNVELQVFYNNEYICELNEFSQYFGGTYTKMIDEILNMISEDTPVYEPKQEKKVVKEAVQQEENKECADYFIKQIDTLNIDIKDTDITNSLHETSAMLKHIKLIEEKYPDSHEKLTKVYQYYLPILVNILGNYEKLASSNSSHEEFHKVEEKLRKTIFLVNEALKTITMQLCEEDIVDLNSDMSVLETILKKDGLVKEGTIYESSVSGNGE